MYRRIAGQFFRYLWLVIAFLVIVYALLIVAGREFLPVINRYQPQISAFLSEKTGMDFNIQSLAGLWKGGTPLIEFNDVAIVNRDGGSSALTIDHITAELNIVKSATNRSPVWRELTVGQIHLQLLEDEKGKWTLGGYPLGVGGGDADLEYLFRMLYYSRLLRIDHVMLDARFYSGAEAHLYARNLKVENQRGFHRITAGIALSETGDDIASLVFEGRGDPADEENFTGKGYLHLNRLNVEGSLHTLVEAWFPKIVEQIGDVETELDLALWFDWKDGALRNGRGHLKAAEVPLLLLPDAPSLSDLDADVTGWFEPGKDWGFRIQNLSANWGEQRIEPVNFQFHQGVGRRWGELGVALNHVDLGVLRQSLLNSTLLNDKGEDILASLNPSGTLRRLRLDINFNGEQPTFKVRGNLDGVAVDSWRGAPAARGVNGYVESDLHQGFVILDSSQGFAMHFPQAYADFMPFGETRGKVAWQWLPDEHRVLVTSNRIAIRGEEGEGRAFVHLDLPTEKGGDPQMDLWVGMKNSHTRYIDRYLPTVLNENLTSWLDRAIGDGEIPEVGFIWRGSLHKHNHIGRSIQVYARLKDGDLDYQQGWPVAKNVSATLVVNNTEMDVWADSGELAGETIHDLGVNLRQRKGVPLLRVVGDLETDVQKAFGVLADSPLSEQLAAVTALQASGPADVDLDLRIPLADDKRLEDFRVTANLRGDTLVIPGTSYQVQKIRGPLRYRHSSGISAPSLTGVLWDKAVKASVKSSAEAIHISASGSLGETGFATLMGPFAERVSGEIPISADIQLPLHHQFTPTVTLDSSLKGGVVDLPAPFTKAGDEELDSQVILEVGDEDIGIRGAVADKLGIVGKIEHGSLSRANVHLLGAASQLPRQDGLLVTGALDHVDWAEWQPVFTPHASGAGTVFPSAGMRLDLSMNDLVVSGFSLGKSALTGGSDDGRRWSLDIAADTASGEVVVPGGEAPLQLTLDYLKVPRAAAPSSQTNTGAGESESAEPAFLAALSPTDIPELDVAIDKLYYGGDLWGNIAFKSRKVPGGIEFTDVEGNIRDIHIKPQLLSAEEDDEDDIDPARLRWTLDDGTYNSFFSGTLEVENIEKVLEQWSVPAPFAAKTSNFYINFGWEGKPWEIDTLALDGYMGIDFRDGQFYEATGSATNALFKLVGLINFDTWLRRLRFDFSDFFSNGLSFDRVQGGLLFRKGLVDFDEPVIASMPGGQIRLLGTADLIYEDLNARLVATMPVGTNLPWVAGLLGGLPAAAGVFLTSKLFEKQVDQLSSIGYKVTGSFQDPDIKVEKIFTDPTKISDVKGSLEEKK